MRYRNQLKYYFLQLEWKLKPITALKNDNNDIRETTVKAERSEKIYHTQ